MPKSCLLFISTLFFLSLTLYGQKDSVLHSQSDIPLLIDTLEIIDTVRISDTIFMKEQPSPVVFKLHASVATFTPGFSYSPVNDDIHNAAGLMNEFSKSIPGYKFTLGASCNKQQWSLYSGLGLSLFKQKLNFSGFKFAMHKESFTLDTLDTYYVSQGNEIVEYHIIDTVWKMQKDSFLYKTEFKNRYLMLEIPILLGYNFKGRTSSFTVSSGPFLFYMLNAKGNAVSFTNENKTVPLRSYISHFGLGWQINCSVNYRFNSHWSIDLTPNYSIYLTSLYNTDAGIRFHANCLVISVGVKWKY